MPITPSREIGVAEYWDDFGTPRGQGDTPDTGIMVSALVTKSSRNYAMPRNKK
ncbi:hypothetical protein [Okeania sp. KiyG1]|uniref:hypothetical protein n=1 Tax=Okeania sp. KiyG1 TaxID=2720165 RepID=UPI0019240F13|nr:hypothetical protein [Okeania sp. KiyG1]